MGTISCPDCGHIVSDAAEACKNCGRPWPAKSASQIASEKAGDEMSSCLGVMGILWFINAFLALMKMGFVGFITALIIGPLIWMIR